MPRVIEKVQLEPVVPTQMRCICKKLICIVKGTDLEIRCNKCKRYIYIKTAGIIETEYQDRSCFQTGD